MLLPMILARPLRALCITLTCCLLTTVAFPGQGQAQDDPYRLYLPVLAGATGTTPPPPPPPPTEGVQAQNFSGYYDLGDYLLLGEVANNLDVPIYDVELAITYFDAAGTVLATDTAAPNLARIEPQSTAPFRDMHFGAPEGITRAEVTVERWSTSSLLDYRPLTILSTNQRLGSGGVVIEGQFRNDTGRPLDNVLLVTSLRDEGGAVVAVLFDYPVIGRLQPGVTMAYTVETFDSTLADATALVQGEGRAE